MWKHVAALLPAVLAFLVGAVPALAWTWPVEGPVLEHFTILDDPYAGGQHRGVDIGAPPGAPVAAPAGGVATFVGTVPGGGRTLTIQTGDGYAVTLLHLGAIQAVEGQAIAEGDAVATIGPSGAVEHPEPYLHLGIRVASDPNGYVDPLTLLPVRPAVPAETPPVEPGPVEAFPGAASDVPAATPGSPDGGITAPAHSGVAEPQRGEGTSTPEVGVVLEPVEPTPPPEPARPPVWASDAPAVVGPETAETAPVSSTGAPAAAAKPTEAGTPHAHTPAVTPGEVRDGVGGSAAQTPVPRAAESASSATPTPARAPEHQPRQREAHDPLPGATRGQPGVGGDQSWSAAQPAESAEIVGGEALLDGGTRSDSGQPAVAWLVGAVLAVFGAVLAVGRRPRPPDETRRGGGPDPVPGAAQDGHAPPDPLAESPELDAAPVAFRPPLPRGRERRGPQRRPSHRAMGGARRASV